MLIILIIHLIEVLVMVHGKIHIVVLLGRVIAHQVIHHLDLVVALVTIVHQGLVLLVIVVLAGQHPVIPLPREVILHPQGPDNDNTQTSGENIGDSIDVISLVDGELYILQQNKYFVNKNKNQEK